MNKEKILERAMVQMKNRADQPVKFDLDLTLTAGLIGQLQLAFRHPDNTGATRQMLEKFVRDLIEQIDPTHGDFYQFLMMGFEEKYDQ